MSEQGRFDVVIDSSGARSGGTQVQSVLNGMKQSFVELSAKIFVFQRTMDSMWRAVNEGARTTETFERLDRQMRSLGSSAGTMLQAIDRATQSQLGMANAAQLASRALAIGLSPTQIATFAQAAGELSDIMGAEIPQAFDQLVSASASGSNRALAQMGIFVDLEEEMRRLAFSTGRTTDQITKQERAMLTAKLVAEDLKAKTDGLGNAVLSQADKLDQAAKFWTDFFDSLKQQLADLTVKAMEFAKPLLDPFKAIIEGGNTFPQGKPGDKLPDKGINTPGDGSQGLPFGLRQQQLQAGRDIAIQNEQARLDRERTLTQALNEIDDLYVSQRLITEEDAIRRRQELREGEFRLIEQVLRSQLKQEGELKRQSLAAAGITTEAKIQIETDYAAKVNEINNKLLANENDRHVSRVTTEAQVGAARFRFAEQARANEASIAADMHQMEERRRQQALDGWELYYKGQMDLANANFENDQAIARNEQALLREQLAFKLRLTRQEIEELLRLRAQGNVAGVGTILGRADPLLGDRAKQGILASGAAQDTLLAERANGDFFSGWARGMQGYIRDTSSGFGMARDMARRTAQTMEQNFQQFFFNPMEKGWEGMLDSMLDMTRQVVSQIMAQFLTTQIIAPLVNGLGGFLGGLGGGGGASRIATANTGGRLGFFAAGGVDHFGSGRLAMLHGPEAVVPLPDGRSIPVDLNLGRGAGTAVSGGISVPVTVINQAGADVQTRQTTGRDGGPELEILVAKAVNRSINEGRMDKAFRTRFGMIPGEQ